MHGLKGLGRKLQAKFSGQGGKSSANVFRHMLTLAFGTAAAKAIGLIAIPILTRVYSPDDFGVLGVYTAFVLIVAPVVSLRYVMAIPVPKSDRLAFNLAIASLLLIVLVTLMLTLAIAWSRSYWFALFSLQTLEPYWWLLPVGVLLLSLYEWLTLWATRKKAFKELARSKVQQAFMGAGTKVVLGLLAVKPLGLLFGQVLQQGGGSLNLAVHFWRDFWRLKPSLNWPRMRWALLWYRHLPYYRLPSQFILIFSTQAPLLFMALVYSTSVTGQLSLALMALGLPMQLIGSTMGSAYFAEVAELGRNQPQRIRALTKDVVIKLALLGVVPCIVLLALGPTLFALVFGADWQMAGEFAQYLAIYLLAQFVTSPLANVLTVLNKQHVFLHINLLRLLLMISVFAACYMFAVSPHTTVLWFALTMTLHYALTGVIIMRSIAKGQDVDE